MTEIVCQNSVTEKLKNFQTRPPVIGREIIDFVCEYVTVSNTTSPIHSLMHSLPDPTGKPPTLLPKPKIGPGAATTQRGPPPPILPRNSSLSTDPSSHNVTDSLPKGLDESKVIANPRPSSAEMNCDESVIPSTLNKLEDKLEALQSTTDSASPNPSKSTSSENSRGFEPEGSVDMSPSYSESNASGGASTSNTTPPYTRWQEGFSILIEDAEGCNLFKDYLTEENLGHYFDFLTLCRALKCYSDDDVRSITKLVKLVYKKYINPRGVLDCKITVIDDASRVSIETKLSEPDRNIFDGAYETVYNHIATQYYPNFLKSEIFVNFVRETETDSRLLSAASSVTGSHNHRDLQVDSGMEEDKAFSSSKSSTVPQNSASDSAVYPNPDKGSSSSSVELLRPLSGASTTCTSSLFNSTQFLPTLDEDRELSLKAQGGAAPKIRPMSQPSQGNQSQIGLGRRVMPREGPLNTWHPPPTNSTRLVPIGPDEVHPGRIASSQTPDPRKPSYAYHANASNWIPVSRQDSELQSLSSGAMGGDTTDDNYSTFTDIKRDSRQSVPKKSREEKHRDKRALHDGHKASAYLHNKENPNQLLPRKIEPIQVHKPYPVGPNPSEDIKGFAEVLISKLNILTKEKESGEKVKKLMNQVNDGDSSIVSGGHNDSHRKRYQQLAVFSATSRTDQMDAESDQSILDDHVNRMFTGSDGPEFASHKSQANVTANTTYMLDMSHRSNNTSMTLPGRSRHGGGYSQYPVHHATAQSHQYRIPFPGATTSSGDLLQSRVPSSSTSKSLIDMNISGSQPQAQPYHIQHHQGRVASYQPSIPQDHKIHNWLKTVDQSGHGVGNVEYSAMMKISPRSSGRYHSSNRARSQDRAGMYNMSQSFTSQYSSTLDPNNLALRLSQQQELHHMNRSSNARSVLSTSVQSGPSSIHGQSQRLATAVVYRFPQEKDDTPYRVKINKKNLTLLDIKNAMPKNSTNFRFYFKTEMNGEVFFEQEINDAALVPMWEEGLVYVQCRND